MSYKPGHIIQSKNKMILSFSRSVFVFCFIALLFHQKEIYAQVISNNGAAISVTSGLVINAKDAFNNAGTLSNGGTINLTGNFTSTASTGGNGTFTIGGNWTNTGGAFTPGTSTVIFNGSVNQSIIRTGGESFFNLTIDNSGAPATNRIGLSENVTVQGTLSLSRGNIDAGLFELLLSNPAIASLNYTSVTGSRIIGKFERGINTTGTYLFPIGTSSYFNPANLIINTVPTAGTVLSEFITGDPGNAGLPVADPPVEVSDVYPDGFWSLTANSFSCSDFSISLDASGFAEPIFDYTRIVKRPAGGNWIVDGTHSDAVGFVCYRDNLTGDISSSGTHFGLGHMRPRITSQPLDQTVCENSNASFSVTATGYLPLTYKWYKAPGTSLIEGGRFTGTNLATLNIANVAISDAGSYYCIVTDVHGNFIQSISALLVVHPLPLGVTTPASQTVCSDEAITTIVLSTSNGMDAGTTYTWTRDNTINVTGLANTGTGDISGTPNNITGTDQTVTYTITPTSADGCVGNPFTATVLVHSEPVGVATPASQTVCSDEAITTIVLSTSNGMDAGTTYTWTRDNTINVTGLANTGTGDISGTPNNITGTDQTVTYTITPTSADGCVGNPFTATVLVHSEPVGVATPPSQTVCSDEAITTIGLSTSNGMDAGTTYTWTRDNTINVTGLADSGTGDISGTPNNITGTDQTVTYTITPTSADGCVGNPFTATVLVHSEPVGVATPPSQTVCSDEAITTIVLSTSNGMDAGTTYTWTRDNTINVTGLANSWNRGYQRHTK